MRYKELMERADLAQKIKRDPRTLKMLVIAMKMDHTLPGSLIAKMGPTPNPEAAADAWSQLINSQLTNTHYGDLAADGKFDDWLLRLYISQAADFEDLSGEAVDALGSWKALSLRGLLAKPDQDFNRFASVEQLQRVVSKPAYRAELRKIENAAEEEKQKRDAKMVVILDNERYNVAVPLNYGACYVRDKIGGFTPNFCTSSSNGMRWFQNYAPDGPIVNIQDKSNLESKWGKWQMHTASRQLQNAVQDNRGNNTLNDSKFASLFPGLMTAIMQALQAHAAEINAGSKEITHYGRGYDIGAEIERIKQLYPKSVASKSGDQIAAPGEEEQPAAGDQPAQADGIPGEGRYTFEIEYWTGSPDNVKTDLVKGSDYYAAIENFKRVYEIENNRQLINIFQQEEKGTYTVIYTTPTNFQGQQMNIIAHDREGAIGIFKRRTHGNEVKIVNVLEPGQIIKGDEYEVYYYMGRHPTRHNMRKRTIRANTSSEAEGKFRALTGGDRALTGSDKQPTVSDIKIKS